MTPHIDAPLAGGDLIRHIISHTDRYNLHSHTQFCDGHATMEDMARAAAESGMVWYAFSPHSPITLESGCNMSLESVGEYLCEVDRLREVHSDGGMRLLASMEVDYISRDWGPHIDTFQRMPLDFSIGSVHFVPTRDGVPVDCDGRFERFKRNLKEAFGGDIRYVVEKYFEQLLTMMELGGFDLLGHADKIAANAAQADPGIEDRGWYEALMDDVVSHAVSGGYVAEINTKAYGETGRFFPALRWWPKFLEAGIPFAVDSDAHWPDRIGNGRKEALDLLAENTSSASRP